MGLSIIIISLLETDQNQSKGSNSTIRTLPIWMRIHAGEQKTSSKSRRHQALTFLHERLKFNASQTTTYNQNPVTKRVTTETT